jgi:NADPH-dependent 2,4-dienoyl-CoA reductase/sulfur reductase-like enzyme
MLFRHLAEGTIMTHYQYLIVSGGMAAAAAVEGIREVDANGSIGLFSAETDAPYNRPPLSKVLWKGADLATIWRNVEDRAVEAHLGRVVREILPLRKRVVDDQGNFFIYKKLLLATGGRPRRLPFAGDRIIYFRTLADYCRLREWTRVGRRFAVIGGGFIASEIAAALATIGKEVVMIFPGKDIGERIFPRELAQHVSGVFRQKGVELLSGDKVVAVEQRGSHTVVQTTSQRKIIVDGVVAGIGIEPDVALAESIGLTVDNGIIVDELLRTSQLDIYAAGDVAAFYSAALDRLLRFEHEDNANAMGRAAGRNMAGAAEPYRHLPFFYSDLLEFGYEAVGELDSRLETWADWQRPNEQGVVYYLKHGRVCGVLLWNVWEQVENARRLIEERAPFARDRLIGRGPASSGSTAPDAQVRAPAP